MTQLVRTGYLLEGGRRDPYRDPDFVNWPLIFDFAGTRTNRVPYYRLNGTRYASFESVVGASYSRTGEQLSYNPVTGQREAFAANVPAILAGAGLDIAEGTTNKCTNYNAAPQGLIAPSTAAVFNAAITGMQAGGDANARFSVVDDTAALRAAGFGALIDAGKLNGRVYKIDNSLGSTSAQVLCYSTATTLIPVAISAFVAGGSGSVGMHLGTGPNGFFAPSSTYQRRVALGTPTNTGAVPRVTADPGQIVYFILNQFEEKAYATNPVIVSGASATRGNAQPVVTGLSSILTPPFTLVAVANLSAIDGVARRLLTVSDGTDGNRVNLSRGGGNEASVFWQIGGGGLASVGASGRTGPRLLKIAGRVRDTGYAAGVDGAYYGPTVASVPPGLNRLDLGCGPANNAYLNSPLLFAGIAPDLTDAQLQALTASNGLLTDFL